MKKLLTLFALVLFLGYISCTKEDPMEEEMETQCETEGLTYNNDIKSILSGCTASSCHGSDSGRSMANFDDAKAYAGQGRILGALRHSAGFSPMPKNGSKLDDCRISQVAAWVADGFPE